CVRWKLGLDYW
nr:immunoglobulin heavy chain junction region [Mus musculus]NSM08439.1 immunoglobulin heavy chain junction region [Mus musculus]NSM08516.1 immunoglobulin heavy chain junction region [Mus musculus]NSM08789.1 immunoglobulin heavy chain junction region [Mus musculus]